MNEQVTKLLEMEPKKKAGLLALVLGAMCALFYLLFYSSVSSEIAKIEDEIDGKQGLKTQIAKEKGVAASLQEFKTEVGRLDQELDKALKELPDKSEVDQLLARISDKATDSGLEISSFKPQGEQKKDFYAEQPVEIKINGAYHQVGSFFDEVGHLERIVNLDQFHIKEPVATDEGIAVSATVIATAFRFLDESERPKEEEKSKARRRK